MTDAALTTAIADTTKEIVMRERAAAYLRDIPAMQNQTAIDRLYDVVNRLHVERCDRGIPFTV